MQCVFWNHFTALEGCSPLQLVPFECIKWACRACDSAIPLILLPKNPKTVKLGCCVFHACRTRHDYVWKISWMLGKVGFMVFKWHFKEPFVAFKEGDCSWGNVHDHCDCIYSSCMPTDAYAPVEFLADKRWFGLALLQVFSSNTAHTAPSLFSKKSLVDERRFWSWYHF